MRDLTVTLPSPSELTDFQTCPFLWLMRHRSKINKAGGAIRLLAGSAVSESMQSFFEPKRFPGDPMEVFEKYLSDARTMHQEIPEDEWQEYVASTRDALVLYYDTYQPVDPKWEHVVTSQLALKNPSGMRLDLVVRLKTGSLAVVEQKLVSSYTDIEYEVLKYEMGFQPIGYTIGASEYFEENVSEVVMDFIIRGRAAKGRYKEVKPDVQRRELMPVEEWKKEMFRQSADFANIDMNIIESRLAGESQLTDVPRFTHNCMKLFGSRTYPCDFYPACSMNMHPLQVEGQFEQQD